MKVKLKGNSDKIQTVQPPLHSNQRVAFSGAFLSSGQAVTIFPFVFEFKSIDGFNIRKQLLTTAFI